MLSEAKAREFARRLQSLAVQNAYAFSQSPALCASYLQDVKRHRFRYVDDKLTCGLDDCWSSYRALKERYGDGLIKLDCEDAASAHAGWLASRCYEKVWIGLVPGNRVSHAIVGVSRPGGAFLGGKIRIIDPCRWYGMPPFGRPYKPVFWERVDTEDWRGNARKG